jgi:hypothetical protein
MDREN